MTDKEFEFNKDLVCDKCGITGAYDIYGDNFCDKCLAEWEEIAKASGMHLTNATMDVERMTQGEVDEIMGGGG